MSGPLRNKQGCWTCRVRRKKCNGARPNCSTCESLSITCYGYGPKPDWIDHGEKEKAMANSLKQIVKHTSRRKIAPKLLKNPAQLTKIAPKNSNGTSSSSSPGSNIHQPGVDPSSDHSSSADEGANTLQGESSAEQPPENRHDDLVLFPILADESASLMHYLDNVFPLQYPMYRPSTLAGGRGWLLSLLLRMKPLYHATMAVSSYHRRKIAITQSGHHPSRVAVLVEQEKHLEICLTEFQKVLRSASEPLENVGCGSLGLGVMALLVQLIYFEFFTGQGSEWKIHLRAATNIYRKGLRDKLVDSGLTPRSKIILCGDGLLSEDDGAAVMEEVMMFKFFTGTIIWLDIISSITAGTAPHLLAHHLRDIASNSSQIRLEETIGCENWVMLQIGRISALHERKTKAQQEDHLGNAELEETVSDIGREIHSILTRAALEGLGFSEGSNTGLASNSTMTLDSRVLVTHIFSLMASIYLHLVAHGFQKLELLDTTICTAMGLIYSQVPAHLLRSMVCPLYVIGSVARQEEEQEFLRNIFSSPPLQDPLFEHRAKVLPALEEIWRRRQNTNGFTWEDSLELVPNLLLL